MYQFRNTLFNCLELVALSMLAIFVTPLISFAIYFCGMHSIRHILRSIEFLQIYSKRQLVLSFLLPSLFIFLVLVIICIYLNQSDYLGISDQLIIKIIFVMLASLTLPHMIMLKQSGFSSWVKN